MKQSKVQMGPLSQLKPTINFANRMDTMPGQEWGPRTIPDCQLLYVISGQAKLFLGSACYELNVGDSIFYGTHSPHLLISSESNPMTFASIHFDWDKESPEPIHPVSGIQNCSKREMNQPASTYILDVKHYGPLSFPHFFTLPELEDLFLQIVREYRAQEHGYASVLRGLLIQLLVVIIRHQISGQYSSTARRKIASALDAIHKQPERDWKIPDLAKVCGYHPTYFASLFREATGHSPKHYLVLERIRKAKSLMLEAETIEEVAFALGYSSTHYFSRNFKSITGLSPMEFKKRSLEL